MAFLDKDLPYKSECNALEALGLQRNPRDLAFLLSYSKTGIHSILRGGVLEALGHHASLESFKYLDTQLRASFFPHLLMEPIDPTPEKAFPSLISAYATSAQWQSDTATRKHAIELLTALLRDPRGVVRKEAIWALCEMGASDSFSAIQNTKPTFPDQDWMFIDKRLRAAREEAGGGRVKELVKSLEDVEVFFV